MVSAHGTDLESHRELNLRQMCRLAPAHASTVNSSPNRRQGTSRPPAAAGTVGSTIARWDGMPTRIASPGLPASRFPSSARRLALVGRAPPSLGQCGSSNTDPVTASLPSAHPNRCHDIVLRAYTSINALEHKMRGVRECCAFGWDRRPPSCCSVGRVDFWIVRVQNRRQRSFEKPVCVSRRFSSFS